MGMNALFTGQEDNVYAALKEVPNLIVYRKAEIPDEFHYKQNRRVMPILIMAPEGYSLCNNKRQCREKGMFLELYC